MQHVFLTRPQTRSFAGAHLDLPVERALHCRDDPVMSWPQRSPDFNFRRYKEKIKHW